MASIHCLVTLWYPFQDNTQRHAIESAASELSNAGLDADEITCKLEKKGVYWEVKAYVRHESRWPDYPITDEYSAGEYIVKKLNPLVETNVTICPSKTQYDPATDYQYEIANR